MHHCARVVGHHMPTYLSMGDWSRAAITLRLLMLQNINAALLWAVVLEDTKEQGVLRRERGRWRGPMMLQGECF